jgi:site-specific recombinase XerD
MTSVPHGSAAGVTFALTHEHGKLVAVETTSPLIDHFLKVIKLSRAYNTWVSYTHDLQHFFRVIQKPIEDIGRMDCVTFLEQQDRDGRSNATINRRLAALSALFTELHMVDAERFPQNPIYPFQRRRRGRRAPGGLYRKQPQRVPDVIPDDDLQRFLAVLPSWRDRALILLMAFSCLRVSEVVAIRFQDIECSRRSIYIAAPKGGRPRTVFMPASVFTVLNRYLDLERRDLFPTIDAMFVAFKGRARGQPLSVNAVQKLIYYYAKQAKIAPLHAHLFRHTGITTLLQHGMIESALRTMVGHHHPDSLLPYLHLTDRFVETEFGRAEQALDSSAWLPTLP